MLSMELALKFFFLVIWNQIKCFQIITFNTYLKCNAIYLLLAVKGILTHILCHNSSRLYQGVSSITHWKCSAILNQSWRPLFKVCFLSRVRQKKQSVSVSPLAQFKAKGKVPSFLLFFAQPTFINKQQNCNMFFKQSSKVKS